LLSDVSTTKLLQTVVNETTARKKLDNMRSDKAGGADDLSLQLVCYLVCYTGGKC